ncbi:MAG TPA: F0F1 ATP synthase subunit A [Patescibacteria group bacterium]|nr:F0F1 ATP synthase subunit A [Patescibacteria group bacterium]
MTDRPDRDRTDAERRMQEALGPDLASDAAGAAGAATQPTTSIRKPLILIILAIVALTVVSFVVSPPLGVNAEGRSDPSVAFSYPADAIKANFELPAPHVVWPPDYHRPPGIAVFDVSIPSTLFTGWIVMALIIVVAFFLSRSIRLSPSGRQNALEYAYEGLANFATSLGGPQARRYVPIFVTFFLYILLSNWSGLLPGVGRTQQLRAPTSDVNMTIGLALVSFFLFHIEGVRALGVGGYLGKFFNVSGFKDGPAAGVIGLFVGLLEFFLEFIKPVTLSMRLFGNIYAGEIALGVITGLTFAIIPVAMVSLEFLLNFMQALIFSVLTLMFTIIATEGHSEDHDAEHAAAAEHHPEGTSAPVPELAHG